MTLIEQLQNKLQEWHGKAKAILDRAAAETRALTPEERVDYDAAEKEIENVAADKSRAERQSARETDTGRKRVDLPPANQGVDDLPVAKTPLSKLGAISNAEVVNRFGKPRLFKGDDGPKNTFASGMWLLAALYGNASARRWCQDQGMPLIRDAASESINTQGGFLVPSVLENMIIDLREEYGVSRQEAYVHPMSSDAVSIPRRAGGLTAYAVGENSEIADSTKLWDQVSLVARKWGVLVKYSSEIAEDAIISIAEDLSREIAYAFAVKEDECLFNGDGTSTYHGIRGVRSKIIDGTHTAGAKDAATAHDTFAEIDAADLATVMAALPKYAERNAKWYVSQPGWNLVFQRLLAAGGGNSMDNLTGKPIRAYLGYPVVITQSMPTSTGDLSDVAMILFGDMRAAATIGTRRGVTLKASEDRYFEFDQLAIRGTTRFDINVHDLGDNTLGGPIVALIGE